jgi:hypothetical protein
MKLGWLLLAVSIVGCDPGEEKVWSLQPVTGPSFEFDMIHYEGSLEYAAHDDAEYPRFGGGHYASASQTTLLGNHASIHVDESGVYWGETFRSHREFWVEADITFQPKIDFLAGTLRLRYWDEEMGPPDDDSEPLDFTGTAYPVDD